MPSTSNVHAQVCVHRYSSYTHTPSPRVYAEVYAQKQSSYTHIPSRRVAVHDDDERMRFVGHVACGFDDSAPR